MTTLPEMDMIQARKAGYQPLTKGYGVLEMKRFDAVADDMRRLNTDAVKVPTKYGPEVWRKGMILSPAQERREN